MRRRAKAVVGPAREQVADVDDEAVLDAVREYPLAVAPMDLQAADVRLIDERQAAVIGVRRDPKLVGGELRGLRRAAHPGGRRELGGAAPEKEGPLGDAESGAGAPRRWGRP